MSKVKYYSFHVLNILFWAILASLMISYFPHYPVLNYLAGMGFGISSMAFSLMYRLGGLDD